MSLPSNIQALTAFSMALKYSIRILGIFEAIYAILSIYAIALSRSVVQNI
jgi:hypothetical protein